MAQDQQDQVLAQDFDKHLTEVMSVLNGKVEGITDNSLNSKPLR